MKTNFLAKAALVLGLTATMIFSPNMAAMADTNCCSPTVARTRAWDAIEHTLGGIPESVRKIEYQNSIFYLAPNVSNEDFAAVIAAGAEAVRLNPPKDNGKLYQYPVYILWNSDKTALLVHPIIFDYDDILEAVSIQTAPPANLTGQATTSASTELSIDDEVAYMLSDEYAEAVRTEFYRLLNEHRVANGLRELKTNLDLQGYADTRAVEQRTRFGHTRPDGSPAGSGWHNSRNNMNTRYAENALNVGAISSDPYDTALGIFSIWKNSQGHNRHMLYNFNSNITMALGLDPKLEDNGFVTSGAIFATGY